MSIGTNSIGLNDSHEIQRRNNDRAGRWIAEKIGEHLAWEWTGGVTGMRRRADSASSMCVAVTWPEMLEEMLRQRFIQKVEIVRRDEDEHPDADDGYRVTVYGEYTPHPVVSWQVTLAAALSNCIVAIVCEYLDAEDAKQAPAPDCPHRSTTRDASGMLCPTCQASTLVYDSRTEPGWAVRRRRECCRCKYRFTTYERIEEDLRDWNI